ncbi:serine--tRNA ligase [Paenibacillus sp. LHD-117]|uniref:serine--tRNA ligase n=1 Tax=Paenibacillus sp. LHD-117 TaxID=3071412 RepID=UPI0027E0F306|nr:serine--tRNA ligase [Paenibacillus sp. LHD-117]MDQ6418744.1 serine--tRNA ligase [Paenibacillus sp. LHD-117]
MLDMKWIREHAEEVQLTADRKGIALSVAELLAEDDRRRSTQGETDRLRETRNKLSEEIGRWMRNGRREEAERGRAEVRELNGRIAVLERELGEAEQAMRLLGERVPNIVSPDTPVGGSDADNVELKRVGEPPLFDFEWRDHMALAELHKLVDVPRGVKTAGSRFYYLTGAGVLLHRAVQQLALDLLIEKGFAPMDVPLMARPDAMKGTGFFPLGEDQTYRIADEERYLVGTSEVPLVTYYAGEIVDVAEPIKLAAASMCFRSEVGSAGRDVHGLYRVHQFAKVEQVVICRADAEHSDAMLQEITGHAEAVLRKLELPYRQMAVCTGDMSQKTYKQYDLETWMPSRGAYGETHSSSNLHDFQARRSNIRYRDENGALRYCHTLNNTAVASPRILIPLLENHQQADGSIRIPEALRPYMYGMAELAAPST